MIDALLSSFFTLLFTLLFLYKWVVIISALLSWVRPDPYNPIVQLLNKLTQPVYSFISRYIPTVFSGIDIAPLILVFILIFVETLLKNLFL